MREINENPLLFFYSFFFLLFSPFFNESHRKVRAIVREFTDKEIMPYCHEWDEAKQVPRLLFTKCAELGLLAGLAGQLPPDLKIPAPIAGFISPKELDGFHSMIICDELTRCGSAGVMWALVGGLGIGLPPVIKFGSHYLRNKVVEDCLSGRKTICLAVTEPSAGSDVANLQCEAKESEVSLYHCST